MRRVQVKTSNYSPKEKYLVQFRTSGGNHSTKKTITKLSLEDVDLIFILCGDGSYYELPIDLVAGKSELTISSKGYDQFRLGNFGIGKMFRWDISV